MDKILKKLSISKDKGNLLESVLHYTLQADNFINVRSQYKGSQFGFDLSADKMADNKIEHWKFECKNLNKPVTVDDFSPKIIWHLNSKTLDKFVLVTIHDISNDLFQLLENLKFAFPIEIWHGEYLEYKIKKSKKALEKLNLLELFSTDVPQKAPLLFNSLKVNFYVNYFNIPPFSFDYFFFNEEIQKAYTEFKFKLIATFENKTDEILRINNVTVKTLRYENVTSRVLRQNKMKGIVKIDKLRFIPSQVLGEEYDILEKENIIKISPQNDETFAFELSDSANSGYYELIFISKGFIKDKPIVFYSPIFPLHIKSKNTRSNLISLNVVGKHYESPVEYLLNLDNEKWNNLKRISWSKKHLVYLGNTMEDIIKNKISKDFYIKTVKKKKENILSSSSKIFMKLDFESNEELFNKNDCLNSYGFDKFNAHNM